MNPYKSETEEEPRKGNGPNGIGHPPFIPTSQQRRLVEMLAGTGTPHHTIRRMIVNPETGNPIAPATFYKVFPEELGDGKEAATARVKANLFRMATGTSPQALGAAIFWLKAQAGWKETTVVERRNVNFDDLTDDELAAIIRSSDDELDRVVADHRAAVEQD